MSIKLGLDIGTNSIGWALVDNDVENRIGKIIGMGSRIIPMDGDAISKFESGNSVSNAANRRQARSARRLLQRYRLRRGRLIQALKTLGWLPNVFPDKFLEGIKFNINDYAPFSNETIEEAKALFNNEKDIPGDWIIYYLRTKALEKEITPTELARLIYQFNQRRGFKSSRKENKIEDEQEAEKKFPFFEKWVAVVNILSVNEISEEKGLKSFEIIFKIGDEQFTAIKKRRNKPDWQNKDLEFEITRKTTKAGEITYTIAEPDRSDWEKLKVAHEKDLSASGLFVGQYYLSNLIKNRNDFRIKDRIIDRHFYKEELKAILEKQKEFQAEFADKDKLHVIADAFYPHNAEKNKELKANDLIHLLMNDIIYYQRDLKSQKHLIAECRFEKKSYINPVTGRQQGVKVAPTSSPAFQEFRIWQTIHNLRILEKEQTTNGKTKTDVDVTPTYLDNDAKARLYELFDSTANISPAAVLSKIGFKKDKIENGEKSFYFKLNYPDDKDFKGNETKALFRKIFRKHKYENEGELLLNDKDKLELLWHIIYSLKEEQDVINALSNKKHFNLPVEIINHLSKLPELPNQYAAYSSKAINKMLPLMRSGKYWSEEAILKKIDEYNAHLPELKKRIEKGIAEDLKNERKVSSKQSFLQKLNAIETTDSFQGLETFLATYLVYGRHSEREDENKYTDYLQMDVRKLLPYNTLRNPIVEKITRETLSLVKEIWKQHGQPNEIHIELGRDLKKNNEERKKISEQITKNENERKRIVAILKGLRVANPESPMDIEKFQLWKDTGGKGAKEEFNGLFKSTKETEPQHEKLNRYKETYWQENEYNRGPSKSDIERYKLWVEQNHISPYTGKMIPLSKLFTAEYEVEHIVPRALFFDDSFGNKTICEAELNSLKDRKLAMPFIEEFAGREVTLNNGSKVKVLTPDDYKMHIDRIFVGKKKRQFKLDEVPEEFLSRQLNDTRYISRTIANLLTPVAKDDNGIIFTNGAITSELKTSWGLHKKWKELLKPRFERLQSITGEKLIEFDNDKHDLHFKKDYKRIDHRHHALDALIIACTSRQHIKYLNTLNAFSSDKKEWEKYFYLLKAEKRLRGEQNGMREFEHPWKYFTDDAFKKLQTIVVSHKNTARLVTKAINKYTRYVQNIETGRCEKKTNVMQQTPAEGKTWHAIRKSMFAQPLGKSWIAEYKKSVPLKQAIKYQIDFLQQYKNLWKSEGYRIAKSVLRKHIDRIIKENEFDEKKILAVIRSQVRDEDNSIIEQLDLLKFQPYATKRVNIDETFTKDKIDKMPYANHPKNWLTKLLKEHLEKNDNDPKKAFKGEELEALYKKAPYPISKVTRKESGEKMEVKGKYVEGDKGTNLFFVIYENMQTGKREFATPSLYEKAPELGVIDRLTNNLPIADAREGYKTIILSPNDLVYVPDCNEKGEIIENVKSIDWNNITKAISGKIYKMIDTTQGKCLFVPHYVSQPIGEEGVELGSGNKSARAWGGTIEYVKDSKGKLKRTDTSVMIKEVCIKLQIDRLGNISLPSKPPTTYSTLMEDNILNEPEAMYQTKQQLRQFSSHQEANEADAKEMASMSPETHLQNVTAFIERQYANELKQPMDKTIKFKK